MPVGDRQSGRSTTSNLCASAHSDLGDPRSPSVVDAAAADSICALAHRQAAGNRHKGAAVRQRSVTEAAGHLQQAGLIQYRRGHITVLHRKRLEKRSCECYAVVKKEYDRLLPKQFAT